MTEATGTPLPAGLKYCHLSIISTSGSAILYLMLSAGSGATTNRIPIPPGATREVPVYGVDWGLTTISLQASASGTTGHVVAWFVEE